VILQQVYFAGKTKTFVGLHVTFPMLHRNKRICVCSSSSVDVQFGYTYRNDRYVIAQFFNFVSKTFYVIRWN